MAVPVFPRYRTPKRGHVHPSTLLLHESINNPYSTTSARRRRAVGCCGGVTETGGAAMSDQTDRNNDLACYEPLRSARPNRRSSGSSYSRSESCWKLSQQAASRGHRCSSLVPARERPRATTDSMISELSGVISELSGRRFHSGNRVIAFWSLRQRRQPAWRAATRPLSGLLWREL